MNNTVPRKNVISKFYFLKVGGHCEAMLDVTKNILLTFKGFCMNFSLELKKIILSHPVTSKQPHKIVQILMRHPVVISKILQIIGLQPRISKVFSRSLEQFFLTVG